jgi:hypothetical protein
MFGTNHYVPILRWKQAEKLALHRLRTDDKARMTPVIEITPKSFSPKKRLGAMESTSGTESLLVNELAPDPVQFCAATPRRFFDFGAIHLSF